MPMDTNVQPVSMSDLSSALDAYVRAGLPVMLWGSPGIGKSGGVYQYTDSVGKTMCEIRASLYSDVDLHGFPFMNGADPDTGEHLAHFARPATLPRQPNTVLFLDELNRATMSVQNACYQLVYNRRIGEHALPDDIVIIAACNRDTDGGGTTKLSQGLANRFHHLYVEPDPEAWLRWASKARLHPMVQAFVKFRPELLNAYSATSHAYPTPRTWESLSKLMYGNVPAHLELPLCAGVIGHNPATQFLAYVRTMRDIMAYDLDNILADPDNARVPDPSDNQTSWALSSALITRMRPDTIGAIMRYTARMSEEFQVFVVLTACDLQRQPDGTCALEATPEYTQWTLRHGHVLSSL